MSNYSLTKRAVQDLKDIWNYTLETWSEEQADGYIDQILSHCALLSNNSRQGKSYDILFPGLRGSKVNRHLLFYRSLDDESTEIVRILHERMDLRKNLSSAE